MEEMTIKDIARICGVGVSTVSRAINNHPDINPETKTMIMSVIEENGYIPNNSARNLKRTEAKSIAVLVKGMSNLFFSTMIKVMEEEIKKKKYTLVLHHVDFNEDEIDVAQQLIKEKRLAGIIFLGGYFLHKEKLEKLPVPFVLSTVSGPPDNLDLRAFSSIAVDDEAESYKMVDYLIGLGHTKIAILSAVSEDESIGKLRLQGYRKALSDHHIPLDEKLILPMREDMEQYSMQNGYAVTRQFLEAGVEFTALYAISDLLAIGACKAIMDSGKKIPEDYSVAGFDGIELGQFYNPSLTTIKQPVEEIAKDTVKILLKVLSDHADHKHQVVPAKLIVGESTRKLS